METKRLTLEMEGPKIRAPKFRKAVNTFLDLIDEVAKDVTEEKSGVQWFVTVRPGSVIIDFMPEPDKAPPHRVEAIPEVVSTGLELLETKQERPQYFSDYALERALDLASIIDVRESGLDAVRVRVNGKSNLLTHKTVAVVEDLLKTPVSTYGTIEGKLETLSVRGRIHCVISDSYTDHAVRCNFHPSDTELFERITQHFRKRIIAYGKVHYKKDGEPKTILIDDFRILPEQKDLPKFKDVYGILSQD